MKEKTSPWFKVLALCTAVGLGGTYIWRQQQKAAPQIEKTVERTVLSGSKSMVIAPPPLPVDQEEADRVLMPGPKSGVFKLKQEGQEERILMPSSKVGIIQMPPEVAKERVLLPSSKSITMPIFRERRVAPADQPKPEEP